MFKIKNILIFVAVAAILVLVYVFFIQGSDDSADLVSSDALVAGTPTTGENPSVASDFLTLLLSVKNITLNDAIFSDVAFSTLRDSSITLTPDNNQGRSNPFASFGVEAPTPPPVITTNPITTTPATPPATPTVPPAKK